MTARPNLGFVGAGKVGTTLARLLFARGFVVSALYSRSVERGEALARAVDSKRAATVGQVIASADLTFIAVPDDVIGELVANLSLNDLSGKAIVHTSGVHEAGILDALTVRGAMVGSLHPIFPFADIEQAINRLPSAAFGIQADSPLLSSWLSEIVRVLDGQIMVIGRGQKALYHSALVFASNYGVTLYAIAQQLLTDIGAESEVSSLALNTLIGGMVRNLQVMGIPDALTGPLVRGDVGTLDAHLAALHVIDPNLANLYRQLAIQTLPLVAARGIDTGKMETLLRKKMDDADNHT